MKSKATRSRRLSRMPNNRSLRESLLHEKYCPKQKKIKKPKSKLEKIRILNQFEKLVLERMRRKGAYE